MKIICLKCNVEISKQVTKLDDVSLLNENDGEAYIPEGFFTIEKFGERDSIIINLKDLINSNHHSDESRLNGCCGYDGLDGMNRVCVNKHEIGTENSECWMPHYIALDLVLVKLVK
ncbi:hypothetical protein [Lysinibacillus agricola]|uniref:hypothetical protein n=1 Tax=Lysinibacillus agricola TaxID=2590012 RepID=UPI003C154B9F